MNRGRKVKLFAETEIPFPYQMRVSKRAKRLNLRVSADRGIQLIVPRFISQKTAINFLQQQTDWLKQHAHIWQQHQRVIDLPTKLSLPSLQQTWRIAYDYNPFYKTNRIVQAADQLIYTGNTDNAMVLEKLQAWVKRNAKAYLTTRIEQLSEQTALFFNALSFRQQRTLWGSCTHQKNISLNCKLIFLPNELIDYVLIHELAHTVHLNHGKHFWQLVKKHCDNYKACLQQLRLADQYIPAWFLQRG
jgi:predicted metal-dependent hydrolase